MEEVDEITDVGGERNPTLPSGGSQQNGAGLLSAVPAYTVSTLTVEVTDYLLIDDPNYYQHHLFILQVWIEQDMYKLNRSYASFVELDSKLRRTFPRSDLPTLPLAGVHSSTSKSSGKRFSILGGSSSSSGATAGATATAPGNERDSMLHRPADVRASFIDTSSSANSKEVKEHKKKLMKRIDHKELIPQKKNALNYYFTDLLRVPEVLMSDVLLYFLDEESPDGDITEEFTEEFMENYELHMLLQDEKPVSKTVRKEHRVPMQVDAGQVILWSFYTKLHDVGFVIYQDDKEIMTYQRYNSHEKQVMGCLEIRQDCKIEFVWDNSYSKFRSKQLEFIIKIHSQETYDIMKMTAQEVKNVKRTASLRRNRLKKVLQKLSQEVMAEMHPNKGRESNEDIRRDGTNSTDLTSGTGIGQEIDSKYFLEQLQKLQNEKKSLQLAYSECEIALVAERSACAKVQQQLDDVSSKKDMIEEELIEVKGELEAVRNDYYDLVHHTSFGNGSSSLQITSSNGTSQLHPSSLDGGFKYAIEDLLILNDATISQSPDVAIANFQALLAYTKALQVKTQELEDNNKQQENTLNKWKVEKKQLKTVAIQFKEKCEVLEHEKAMIVAQCEEFHHKVQMMALEQKQLEAANEELKKVAARQEIVIAAAKMREVALEEENAEMAKAKATGNAGSTDHQEDSSSQPTFSFIPLSRGSSFVSVGENSPVRTSASDTGTSSPMLSSSFSSSSMLKKLFEAASSSSANNAGPASVTPPTSASPVPIAVTEKLEDAKLKVQVSSNEGSAHGGGIAFDSQDDNGGGNLPQSPDQYKKMIVYDFAKVEPDEISEYLNKATSSLMDMMPTWDTILGINEESNRQGSTNSSHSSNSNQATELTTFSVRSGLTADGSPVPEPIDSTVTEAPNVKSTKSRNGSIAGGNNSNNSSYIPITSTFRSMTFGF